MQLFIGADYGVGGADFEAAGTAHAELFLNTRHHGAPSLHLGCSGLYPNT